MVMFQLRPLSRQGIGSVFPSFMPPSRIVRQEDGLPDILCESGTLEVRLARTKRDIRRAQRLRFKVFFKEMNATPDAQCFIARRDIDPYDKLCDHLLVIDRVGKTSRFGTPKPKVVGTYRLLRADVARKAGSDFYTAGEYDLAPLFAAFPEARLLELGRSCVLKPYRGKRVVELLWQGIWTYVRHHRIDVMFGCASLEGADAARHALPLSFLHHHAGMPQAHRVHALPWRRADMQTLPEESLDPKAAIKALPPLIKGYLRLGATFGDGAVIDHAFGTTDVFVMLKVADIDARYITHYS
jgi:L-ornithine Nalpha-acyltransferase